MAAFKDYEPGSGGGGGAPAQAAASQEPEQAQDEEEPEEEEAPAGPSGDFPPHTVMGLPALSPTMSQGARIPSTCHSSDALLALAVSPGCWEVILTLIRQGKFCCEDKRPGPNMVWAVSCCGPASICWALLVMPW